MMKKLLLRLFGLDETYLFFRYRLHRYARAINREVTNGSFSKCEVDIIMPSLSRLKYLKLSLASLYANAGISFKLIIVDDGSEQEVVNYLKLFEKERSNVKVIYLPGGNGAGFIRQQGLSVSESNLVAFLDNDICIMPGYFENLIKSLLSRKEVLGVQSKVVFPNGKIQINNPIYYLHDGFIIFNDLDTAKDFDDPSAAKPCNPNWIPIGATLWKKEAFKLFSFDAEMKTSFEDNDFSYRISQAGYKFLNVPNAVCLHYHSSFTQNSNTKRYILNRYSLEIVRKSAKRFYKKHGFAFAYGDIDKFVCEELKFASKEEYLKFLSS